MLAHLDDLRHAYGALDGLALLRALLREGPLKGRTALVSSFGAESAVLLDMVATVEPTTPVIFLDTGKLFEETQDYREEIIALLGLRDVRVVRPEPVRLARRDPDGSLWRRLIPPRFLFLLLLFSPLGTHRMRWRFRLQIRSDGGGALDRRNVIGRLRLGRGLEKRFSAASTIARIG